MSGADGTQGDEDESNYAERSRYRVVLIMFRPDGKGGIQGIVMDSFYIDNDGNIANEFYLVSDSTNGEIKKIDDQTIRQIQDPSVIQKAFYQHFLMDKKRDDEGFQSMSCDAAKSSGEKSETT